jgi:hypothetical protein
MSVLTTLLREAKEVSLTDSDIRRICLNKVKFVVYDELQHVTDIYELLDPYSAFILFYTTTGNFVGHWTAVIYHEKQSTIEFFDSYGLNDRQILALATDSYKDVQGKPLLTGLLDAAVRKYGVGVRWPAKRLQSRNVDDVATCGRYAALRVRFADLSQQQFINMLSGARFTPDDLVSLLTVMFSEGADDLILKNHKK